MNLIFGGNAAGKTTLLESIYCMARGKSFRTAQLRDLCGPLEKHWAVFGNLVSNDNLTTTHAIHWQPKALSIRVNEQEASVLKLVESLPLQLLDPTSYRLLHEGPAYRRAFLDWGVFHVEQSFMTHWKKFQRALKQRNAALRMQLSSRVINVWNGEIAEAAGIIDGLRKQHLALIKPFFSELSSDLLIDDTLDIELRSGWDTTKNLAEVLEQQHESDKRIGTTLAGPHRAELVVKALNRHAKTGLSRGQQKLLIAGLLLSQCLLIKHLTGVAPVLLVDDFSSELSAESQAIFLRQLQGYPGQVFLSSFEDLPKFRESINCKTFHVEQNRVSNIS